MGSPENHPLNLNSAEFDSESYVNHLLQRKGLDELVAVEEDMVQNVRRLDAEMQQLVYENYSKFLTATNIVRNMQTQLASSDEEMKSLSTKMKDISTLSETLSTAFLSHREHVRKLTDANKTVKSLRNAVKLPLKLQELVEQRQYERAIKIYVAAKQKLEKYKDAKSVAGIFNDSLDTMTKLQEQLTDRLSSKVATSEEITEAVDLLRKLGVPEDDLRKRVLTNWNENSQADLANVEMQTSRAPEKPDILEFADAVCNFLANLSLWSSLSMSLFGSSAEGEIMETTEKHCVALERLLTERFEADHDVRECAQYVSALDRIYRKLSACSRLITAVDLHKLAVSTVIRASRSQIRMRRRHIVASVVETLTELSKTVESGPVIDQEAGELVKRLEQAFTIAVKTALANLLLFTASDITFSSLDPSVFYVGFGIDVHEEVVVGSTRDLLEMPTYSGRQEKEEVAALMMLIYAQFLKNVRTRQLNYLLDLCQEQYRLNQRKQSKVTSQDSLQNEVGVAADNLLRKYVTAKGSSIGQILVSSMESRDWLNCSKPQAVRAAVKRVVEYIEKADHQIRLFVEDCTKKERTPDSVRSTSSRRGPGGSYDTSSLSSALEKLWVERSEATTLDFKHDSILEAIVRFVLKCLVDAARQQFFSANGFEQIQIDCYYLKQRLWKFVPDEHVLNSLVDEVISSSVNQCSEPKILDPATLKDICDKDGM